MKTLLALLLGLVASTEALALPTDIAAEYRLVFAGLTIGRVSETYSRTGDTYAIRSVASAIFTPALRQSATASLYRRMSSKSQ
jgi:hypothetical protein